MGMQLSQVFPESGLSISTPATRQPRQPIVIAPGSTRQLTLVEIKQLFNHIPSNEISTTPGLFDDYANGSFGLLPEGDYTAHLTAYKWDPTLATPVVVSNPISGTCNFTICYKAQAPQFITPTLMGSELLAVATVSESNTQFTWTESTIMCNPRAQLFRYDFVVKEMMPGQQPDVAMDRNPVVYQSLDLLVPMCVIPPTVINKLDKTKVYVAQVTAKAVGKNPLDYVLLENNGKSTYRMFRFGDRSTTLSTGGVPYSLTSGTPIPSGGLGNNAIGNTGSIPYSNINPIGGGGISTRSLKPNTNNASEDDKDKDKDYGLTLYYGVDEVVDDQSQYTFRNPELIDPLFFEGSARKVFVEDNIKVSWKKAWFLGGEGERPDLVKFDYQLGLYKGECGQDFETIFSGEPVYTFNTQETEHTILWKDIKDKVKVNDYLVLHVVPSTTTEQVTFVNDKVNVKDFALSQLLSKQYFQCSDMVTITNTTPTNRSAQDLKGKVVGFGQYELTIDDISKVSGKNAFKGKGHIEWNPMGYTVMVAVKFDELYINSDNVVYQGEAVTYPDPDPKKKATDAEVVDKILSDTGVDQIISDTGIPYANLITEGGVGALKDIAKKYDVSKYYEWVRTGKNWYDNFLNGDISDLHLPLKLPKSVNKTPVDIQIASMKFTPTNASMNIIGELVLPKSNYTRNEILVLGAPRICMSPDRVLPEGGSISLLSDFTVVDPSTKFEMTFNAPQNVVNPTDGCYISWKADELELILLDFDMQIPKLKKVDANGDATNERPILNIKESIASWDELVANVTMDNFEVDGLNGWLFKPGEIVFDYSMYRNGGDLDIPKGYSWKGFEYTETEFKQNPGLWKGIYINDMEILFPKTLQFGNAKNTEDGRLKIAAEKVIYDFSGLTLSLKLASLLDAKTTKLGGWAFSIDNLQLNILQSKFKDCFFDGKFDVPLLDGTIGYKCDLTSQGLDSEGQTKGYDFTFTTKQIDGLKLDFFLGQADFKKNWTFFELSGGTGKDTHVELCAGGYVTIKGTKADDSNLVFNLLMPKIKFAKMRVGNFPLKDSKLAKNIKTDQGWTLLDINKAAGFKEEYTFTSSGSNSSTIYFGPGSWSLSSLQKNIGPFGFTLKKYGLKQESNKLGLNLAGAINVMDNMISAETDLTIWGKVNLNNFSASYSETQFNRAAFGVSWAGVDLSGSLVAKKEQKGNSTISGYTGTLHFKMPGNIVEIDGEGGYYSYSSTSTEVKNENDQNFKYGYFIAKVGGKGLHIPPVVINEVKGGFYFNCTAKKDQNGDPTPRKGLIGGVFGLGLAVEGGDNLLNGKFDMTVVYDTKYKCLSTFLMNGTLNALSTGGNDGIISAKATIAYQCLKDNSGPGGSVRTKDQYFSLDLSCDVKVTPENLAKAVTTTIDQYVPLMNELEGNISAVTGKVKDSASQWVSLAKTGLNETMGTDSENNTFNDGEKAPASSEKGSGKNQKSKEAKASAGGHIALNFKITKYENYNEHKKPKWHVYLGEPGDGTEASEEEKRCGIKIIDLKAKVVTVKIGANAYLCVGNELPNNGVLPPIPADIRNFLNGGSMGSGVEQADAATVNRSREAAMEKFLKNAENSGGVMFGYKAYGYIDVDLGLLYAYLGAVAGIDVSLVKINSFCNGKQMGIKGWYATGQAYAMLEAKMGIRIRLGFYNNDFDILHAQIGAMLKAGLPNPFWMVGQARVKLKLLGGLIKLNRSFKFECGSVCLPYLGSPLDNFELFTNCSVGGESRQEGWEDAEPITYANQIVVETSTDLATRLNLYDENFAQELAFNRGGSNDDYKEYSNRSYTFNFATVYRKRVPGISLNKEPEYTREYVSGIQLTEFSSPDINARDSINYGRDYISVLSDGNHHRIVFANSTLKPNRYYKLYLYGNAKEIRNGLEVDPYSMDTLNGTYGNYPWSTMKVYYFRTGNFDKFTSNPEVGIQNDVALAFPSPDGHMVIDTLNSEPRIYTAYQVDISRPNIAFKGDISSKFDNNRLKWALYDETAKKYVSENISNYKSSYVNENLNWLPDKKLIEESNLDPTHVYVIKLEYVRPKTAAEKKAEADAKAAEEEAKAEAESSNVSGSSQSSGSRQNSSSSSGPHYFVHGGVVYEEGSVHKTTYESQLRKKKQLADALKAASTSGSSSSGSTSIKRTSSSGNSSFKRAASSSSSNNSSSSNAVKSSRARRATTKYLPPMMQNPVRGNVNTRMVGDMNKTGKVGNGGTRMVNQQPSISPTTNVEKAAQEFSTNINKVLTPNNGNASANIQQTVGKNVSSVVIPGRVTSTSGSKVVSSSSITRPTVDNVSFKNPVTKVEAKGVEDKVNKIETTPVFSNKPSSHHIPTTKEEIIAEFFPNGRPSKGIDGRWTIEAIQDYVKNKGIDRVRPDIVNEIKAEMEIREEIAIAGHGSGGSSSGGSSSGSSSSSSQPEPWAWPEPTDQENKHVLLFGIRVQPSKVINPVTEEVIQDAILSYSYPFMGDNNYGVDYKYNISVLPSDYDLAFDKSSAMVSIEGEGRKSIRLIDPYFYYNYLGGYANVSGWEARRYKYDDYPNLSTQGLVFTSKYHTVTPTLAEDPIASFVLANNARNYRNYTNVLEKRRETQGVGSIAAYVGGLPTSSIPSKSNFPNCTWLTDEGFSWVSPVRYTGFMAHYVNSQFLEDLKRPYSELSSFTDALHRATRYFEDFFEDERGLFNEIYRGCYINQSNCWFFTNESEWKGAAFEGYEHMSMLKEYNDSMFAFCQNQLIEHPYLFQQVESFIKEFFYRGYHYEEVWSDLEKFWKDVDKIYSTKTLNNGMWSFKYNSKEKDWKERLNKYKNPQVDLEQLHNNLLMLILKYDSFHHGMQGVYNTVYAKWNPDWDKLWVAYLRGRSSMYDDQYLYQMPFQQIPLMYASQFKGENKDSKRTKLEEVLVGMSGSHPRRNRDEAKTIWNRMADSNYEKFDFSNIKYVKGFKVERHRVNTFNFKKGAYEVYNYSGNEIYPESSKQKTIQLDR